MVLEEMVRSCDTSIAGSNNQDIAFCRQVFGTTVIIQWVQLCSPKRLNVGFTGERSRLNGLVAKVGVCHFCEGNLFSRCEIWVGCGLDEKKTEFGA